MDFDNFDISEYAVYLNNRTIEIGSKEECLKRYEYELQKWDKEFANKEIDRNDRLVLKNVYEDYIEKETTIMKYLL